MMHDKPVKDFEMHAQHCQTALNFFEWLNKMINLLENADYLRSVVLLKKNKFTVSWKKTSLFNDTRPWISFGFINPTVEELGRYSVIEPLNEDSQSSKHEISESNMSNDVDTIRSKKFIMHGSTKSALKTIQEHKVLKDVHTQEELLDLFYSATKEAFDLTIDELSIITSFYQINNSTPSVALSRKGIIKQIQRTLGGFSDDDKDTHLISLKPVLGQLHIIISIGNANQIKIPVDRKQVTLSCFYKSLEILNISDNVSSLLSEAHVTHFLNLNGFGSGNKLSGDLNQIVFNMGKNDHLNDAFIIFLAENGVDLHSIFSLSGKSDQNVTYWSDALTNFKSSIISEILRSKLNDTSLHESIQKSLDLIDAVLILNSPINLKCYCKKMTYDIQKLIHNGKNTILNLGNPFLNLHISADGVVHNVSFRYSESEFAYIQDESIHPLTSLFSTYESSLISSSGYDGFGFGKTFFFSINSSGEIISKSLDTLTIDEYKLRTERFKPQICLTNKVTTKRLDPLSDALKVYEELSFFNNKNEIPTYNLPNGGSISIRRVIESFQRIFGIFPASPENPFTRSELLQKIMEKEEIYAKNGSKINLRTLLKKWILKQTILAFFQNEPGIKVDENGFIIFLGNKGEEFIYSIVNDNDSLSGFTRFTKLFGEKASSLIGKHLKHVADIEVFDGIKIGNTIQRTIEFDDGNVDIIKLSAFTSTLNRKSLSESNFFELLTNDNNKYWISTAIFHSRISKSDRYYVFMKRSDGTYYPLVSHSYKHLKVKIVHHYEHLFSKKALTDADLIKNLPFLSVYVMEGDELRIIDRGQISQITVDFEKNNRVVLHDLMRKLQRLLLNGVMEIDALSNEPLLSFGLNIFNTAIVKDDNFSPHVSNYISLKGSGNTISKLNHFNHVRNTINQSYYDSTISEWNYRLSMSNAEKCDIKLDMHRVIDAGKFDIIARRKFDNSGNRGSFSDLKKNGVNFNLTYTAILKGIQLVQKINNYYFEIGEKVYETVLPVYLMSSSGKTSNEIRIAFEISKKPNNNPYLYDFSQVIHTLKKPENTNLFIKSDNGYTSTRITLNDLIMYNNEELDNKSDLANSINQSLITNFKIGKKTLNPDGTTNIHSRSWVSPLIPIRIVEPKKKRQLYLESKSSLLLKKLIQNERITLNMNNEWEENMQIKFNLSLKNLLGKNEDGKTGNGGKMLLETIHGLEESLIDILVKNPKILGKTILTFETTQNFLKHKIITLFDFINLIDTILKNIEASKRYFSFDYLTLSAKERSTCNASMTILASFFFDIYEIMTDYGRYKPIKGEGAIDRDGWLIERKIIETRFLQKEFEILRSLSYKKNNSNSNILPIKQISLVMLDEYINLSKTEDKLLKMEIINEIRNILTTPFMIPSPLKMKHQKENERIYHLLFSVVTTQNEIDRLFYLKEVDLVQIKMNLSILKAWNTMMNIGSSVSARLKIDNSVRRLINEFCQNGYNENLRCDVSTARFFSLFLSLQAIMMDYV
ncbi:MAG: hypothetical protein ACTSYA_07005 [Candidatus Kariarchaeaceae archaeon]